MKKLILGCMFAVLLAGCQSAPKGNGDAQSNKEPEPKANSAAVNNEPEPQPEPETEPENDPNIVGGQDAKQVIFVLGVDGMD